MSKLIDLDLHPDERTLRQFGWIALVGFGFVACIAWFELLIFAFGLGAARPWVAGMAAGLALTAGVFSLVYPRANRPIYLGMAVITYPIGFVLSYVIMGTLFYVLIAPLAIVFKIAGRDSMNRSYDPSAASYWSEPRPRRPNEAYFKQF